MGRRTKGKTEIYNYINFDLSRKTAKNLLRLPANLYELQQQSNCLATFVNHKIPPSNRIIWRVLREFDKV